MEKPETKSNQLLFGENPAIAIVTLWTPIEVVAKRLEKKEFGIIGNLYNAERGLDALVRSLLSNPPIKHLVITGSDMGKSGQVLQDFFESGFSKGKTKDTGIECWKVKSSFEGYIDSDIPLEALETLRKSVRIYRWDLVAPFSSIPFQEPSQSRPKQVFEKKAVFVKKFFSEPAGFFFRGTSFAEAWLGSLDTVEKMGIVENQKKSLSNALFFLAFEKKPVLSVPDFFGFGPADCQKQAEQAFFFLIRQKNWSENRFDGFLDWNQKKLVCWKQKTGAWTHFSVVVPAADVWQTAELLAMLQALAEHFSIPVSITVLISNYEFAVLETERAQEIVKANYLKLVTPPRLLRDWRGNFVVYVSHGEIVVEHASPSNELLWMYTGKTALELRDQLMRENLIGTIPHAVYLGTELQKAEIALKMGLKYIQDQPLDFETKSKS